MKKNNKKATNAAIAIIGMGCLFPRGADIKEYWRLLSRGENAITDIPDTHWSVKDYYHQNPKQPDHTYCRKGGFLSPVAYDPAEFGTPPNILEATDTSQLLGLLVAKKALEDAGYDSTRKFDRERVSVILGATGTQELVIPLGARLGHPIWRKALTDSGIAAEKIEEVMDRISTSYVSWQENSFPGLLGNVIPGRITNRLDLGGTNCAVDAACASSLSALNLAILELQSGRCDMALTGGVDTLNDIFMHMCFSQTGVLSHTSDARPFSENADGTVLGEGIGILTLKRLADAEKDGDHIYAVIKSIGSSSDGKSQSIYAPNATGQAKALRTAYREAGIEPGTVDLVEAHGTGTRVGDAVEFSALKTVFGESRRVGPRCAVGSVKSSIGHTKAAAGAAGMIKAALSLHHKVLPATLKVGNPDPKLGIENSPFFLNTKTRPWISVRDYPRRCGVSAFGFGGSNFHAVLEEYGSQKKAPSWDGAVEIIAFSASENSGLVAKLSGFLSRLVPRPVFKDIARAAATTRKEFSSDESTRLLFVLERPDDASGAETEVLIDRLKETLAALEAGDISRIPSTDVYYGGTEDNGKLAFLFPGQGSQYIGMGSDLACCFPEFHEILDTCNLQFHKADQSREKRLSDLIFQIPTVTEETPDAEAALRATEVAQPSIGAVSLSMMRVLARFGITPHATAGHSYGELPALFAAGRLGLEDVITLSIQRGKFMAATGNDSGTMLAVKAPLADLDRLIQEESLNVVLANRNAPEQGVLSGDTAAITAAQKTCKEKGYRSTRLPVSAAFHSSLVAQAAAPFQEALKPVPFDQSDIPVFSNRTAEPYPVEADQCRHLLGEQLLNPVNFVQQIENMYAFGVRTFVEVGPKPVLGGLVSAILKGRPFHSVALDRSSGRKSGMVDLAGVLCRIAADGHPVLFENWEEPMEEERKQMMSIPISGANYRAPFKQRPPAKKTPAPQPEKSSTQPPPMDRPAARQSLAQQQGLETTSPVQSPGTPALPTAAIISGKAVDPKQSTFAGDALRIVSESLKSMQALQAQTAETHRKFLETQTEATRSLQSMLERTQHLTESAFGLKPTDWRPVHRPRPETTVGAPLKRPEAPPGRLTTIAGPAHGTPDLPIKIVPMPAETEKPAQLPTGVKGLQIEKALLAVVSELTGYPIEMLSPDMDIEADLGIDSIKRVEILSAFEEKMPDLPSVSPDALATLKTLGQIVAQVTAANGLTLETHSTEDHMGGLEVSYTYPSPQAEMEDPVVSQVIRRIVVPVEKPLQTGHSLTIPKDHRVYILDDRTGLGKSIAAALGSRNIPSELIPMEALNEIDAIGIHWPKPAGLVLIPDVDPITDRFTRKNAWNESNEQFLKAAFQFSKAFGPLLMKAGQAGGAFFTTITRLDGCFGFSGQGVLHPLHGGLSGLVKTAAIEWPKVQCNAIDVDPSWKENDAIATKIVDEMVQEGPVEVGLTSSKRFELLLQQAPSPEGRIDLSPKDVVIITGGARGVTAACAYALAKHAKPSIALLGRSQPPMPEPEWLRSLQDEATIKKAIIAHEFSDGSATPVMLEKAYKRHMANREMKRNLENLKSTGARIRYYSVDVRDPSAVGHVLDRIRSEQGPIAGLIHGAGVLEDRFIIDKTLSQFEKVFDTKAGGLKVLLEATTPDKLRYLVFFSSVAGRMGNKGQVDYAMANEVLNKIAQQEAFHRKKCRVVSINWGPWDGGMVSPALRREFKKQHIDLIPIDSGAMCMIYEMMGDRNAAVEVVIGAGLLPDEHSAAAKQPDVPSTGSPVKGSAPNATSGASFHSFRQTVDLINYPILEAHILGGKPVVPFALMAEWIGHGALHLNPDLALHGIDDMRLLSGIKLNGDAREVVLLAGEPEKVNAFVKVPVELRNNEVGETGTVHARGTAILTENLGMPPAFSIPSEIGSSPYPKTIQEAYEEILFHGEKLRGIREIRAYSPKGMIAHLAVAPLPHEWILSPFRDNWLSDPLVLDAAFQMAILWCHQTLGRVSLPSYSASYRQYAHRFPQEDILAVLEVSRWTDHKMEGNFTFLGKDNQVVAKLQGYEAIMDVSLMKAFKPATAEK